MSDTSSDSSPRTSERTIPPDLRKLNPALLALQCEDREQKRLFTVDIAPPHRAL